MKSKLVKQLIDLERIPFSLLLEADESLDAIKQYIYESEIYIIEKSNRIIAVIAIKVINKKCLEIKNVAVKKNYRGRGIGTQLLKYAATIAEERKFIKLIIGTGDHSIKQLELYQKLGFVKFKLVKDFFLKNYPYPIYENQKQLIDMVLLKKDIGPKTKKVLGAHDDIFRE